MSVTPQQLRHRQQQKNHREEQRENEVEEEEMMVEEGMEEDADAAGDTAAGKR